MHYRKYSEKGVTGVSWWMFCGFRKENVWVLCFIVRVLSFRRVESICSAVCHKTWMCVSVRRQITSRRSTPCSWRDRWWLPQGTRVRFLGVHSPRSRFRGWYFSGEKCVRHAMRRSRHSNECVHVMQYVICRCWQKIYLCVCVCEHAEKPTLVSMHQSPRMVPGAAKAGLVSPMMFLLVFTTSLPSQTIATTGADIMYSRSAWKPGLLACLA